MPLPIGYEAIGRELVDLFHLQMLATHLTMCLGSIMQWMSLGVHVQVILILASPVLNSEL